MIESRGNLTRTRRPRPQNDKTSVNDNKDRKRHEKRAQNRKKVTKCIIRDKI